MLLILQRQGRCTARELAETLEVSERTILRDVEVLSEAGVPIYTAQGKRGGIELLDGFETNLTGLTTDEARSMFLAGQPQVAHRLGLAAPARVAGTKLLQSLPPALAAEAESLSEWFVSDPDPIGGSSIPHGELRRISRCIHRRRRIEIVMAPEPARVTHEPLGLVLKAGSWFLVANGSGGQQAVCIDQLRSTRLTNQPFDRPVDFDLQTWWSANLPSP